MTLVTVAEEPKPEKKVKKEITLEDIPPLLLSEEEMQKYAEKYSQSPAIQQLASKFPFDPALLAFLHFLEGIRDSKETVVFGDSVKKELDKRASFYHRVLPSSFFNSFKKLFDELNIQYIKEEKESNESE